MPTSDQANAPAKTDTTDIKDAKGVIFRNLSRVVLLCHVPMLRQLTLVPGGYVTTPKSSFHDIDDNTFKYLIISQINDSSDNSVLITLVYDPKPRPCTPDPNSPKAADGDADDRAVGGIRITVTNNRPLSDEYAADQQRALASDNYVIECELRIV